MNPRNSNSTISNHSRENILTFGLSVWTATLAQEFRHQVCSGLSRALETCCSVLERDCAKGRDLEQLTDSSVYQWNGIWTASTVYLKLWLSHPRKVAVFGLCIHLSNEIPNPWPSLMYMPSRDHSCDFSSKWILFYISCLIIILPVCCWAVGAVTLLNTCLPTDSYSESENCFVWTGKVWDKNIGLCRFYSMYSISPERHCMRLRHCSRWSRSTTGNSTSLRGKVPWLHFLWKEAASPLWEAAARLPLWTSWALMNEFKNYQGIPMEIQTASAL